jgi:hypothetical protein
MHSLKNILCAHNAIWPAPLQISFAILCVFLRIGTADFTLHRFTNRTIGPAIINGIDPQMRRTIYFQSIIIFYIAIVLSCVVVHLIDQYLTKTGRDKYFELEKKLFFKIGLLLLGNLIVYFNYVIRRKPCEWAFMITVLLLFVVAIIAAHACLKLFKMSKQPIAATDSLNKPPLFWVSSLTDYAKYFELEKTIFFEIGLLLLGNSIIYFNAVIKENPSELAFKIVLLLVIMIALLTVHTCLKLFKISRQPIAATDNLNNPLIFFASFTLPIPFTYLTALFLSAGSPIINIYSLQTLFIYILFYLVVRYILLFINTQTAEKLLLASMPLFFIPSALVISNEIQYTFSKQHPFSPKVIAVYFCLALIGISLIYYFRINKITPSLNKTWKRVENLIIPLMLATLGLYMYHRQFLYVSLQNLLDGEGGVVVAYQFLKFGRLPWLDIWPVHDLPIGHVIYGFLNGFNQMEPLLGGNLFLVLFNILVVYFSAKTILPVRWTVLLSLFAPLVRFAGTYYIAALLPLLYLKTMWAKKRLMDYSVFFALSLIAFMWMSSAGKISVISVLIMAALSCSSKKDLSNIIRALLLVFGIPIALYAALTLIQGESPLDKLILIKAFASGDFDIGSYVDILNDSTSFRVVVLCYGLFPLAAILTIMYAMRKIREHEKFRVLIFVSVALLISFIRSFARHSLIEGAQIHFFTFLLLMLPFGIGKIKSRTTKAVSICIIAIFMLVLGSRVGSVSDYLALGIKDFEVHQYQIGEKRYTQNDSEYPHNLRKIMDFALNSDQTFFDIINGHLLYTLMEREVLFLHSLVHVLYSEPPQAIYVKQLEEKLKQNLVPIIIFDSSGFWGDEIDGIPTEFSLSKLSEFIYQNYEPWIRVDGFHLWRAKNSGISSLQDVKYRTASVNMDKDIVYTTNDLEILQNNDVLTVQCGEIDPWIAGFLRNQNVTVNRAESYELKIVCKSSAEGSLQAFYDFNEHVYNSSESAHVNITKSDDYQTYYLPIPKRNDNTPLVEFRIDPPNGSLFEIKSLDIITGEIMFHYEPYIQQNWNLIKLPYIWANYDDKIKKNFPQTLLEIARDIIVEEETIFPVSSDFDKTNGNYLYFEVDSETDGTLSVSYGENIINSVDFSVMTGNHKYLVRISSQYNWMNDKQTMIKINISAPMYIKQISILEGD